MSVEEMLKEFARMSEPQEDDMPRANGAVRPGHESIPYEETPGGILWHRPTKDGEIAVLLTSFTARIISDLAEDDGVEVKRCFEIEARQGGRVVTVRVPAEKYAPMGWPTEALGAKARIAPGQGAREHARYAIQLFSDAEIKEKRVYTHVGWRKINGEWVYLHAGGAIGAGRPRAGVAAGPPAAASP